MLDAAKLCSVPPATGAVTGEGETAALVGPAAPVLPAKYERAEAVNAAAADAVGLLGVAWPKELLPPLPPRVGWKSAPKNVLLLAVSAKLAGVAALAAAAALAEATAATMAATSRVLCCSASSGGSVVAVKSELCMDASPVGTFPGDMDVEGAVRMATQLRGG